MKILSIASLSFFLFAVTACKDKVDPEPEPVPVDQLRLSLVPTFGSDDLVLDQTYLTDEGYRVQFTDLKCFITEVKSGSKTLCSSSLFDFRESGTTLFTKSGKPTDFLNLTAKIGVSATNNHADPTAFSTTDPLYLTNANDMYWGWNPGYIFAKIEAKVDTIDNGIDNFDHLIVFHIGADEYLRALQFNSITWNAAGSGLYQSSLKLDMKTFLNNGVTSIDLKTEHSSHTSAGQEAISLKVIDQFKDAISIY